MKEEDFLEYYQSPANLLTFMGGDYENMISIYPDASGDRRNRNLANNSVYRFIKSGLVRSAMDGQSNEDFLALIKKAPLDAPLGEKSPDDFINAWIGPHLQATPLLFRIWEESAVIDPLEQVSSSFREKLSRLFTEAGVGFEKGDVWPPKDFS